ncbi:NlpC/P60 family protein [Sphingobacterium sp. LRF_L2]|uniref:C40 family peptidase n=1 Tax=Sphingobacterium sp. LRF_L2 TaxID=3369421 RepID=UPI003F602C18
MNFFYWRVACLFLFWGYHLITLAQTDSSLYFKLQEILEEKRIEFVIDKRNEVLELSSADVLHNIYRIRTTSQTIKTNLEKSLLSLNGSFIVNTLPDTSATFTKGLVNLSVANLRTKPSHAAEMATQLLLGNQVDILQQEDGNYRVRTPEGYIAWVPTSSIVPLTDLQIINWKTAKRVIYTAEFGRSYSQPNLKSQRISDLVYGNILKLESEEKDFYRVSYPDNRVAYLAKDEAILFDNWLTSREPSAENIIASAKTMLGLPYLWGGTSVKGVDCSGFTKTSYFMNGYIIPRDASQQVQFGLPVDILDADGNFSPEKALNNLQPADLLFFAAGKNKNNPARVTHVALYIGNGIFIHAAGTVRINSMLKDSANYDDFQTRTVVAARRYLKVNDSAIQPIAKSDYYIN